MTGQVSLDWADNTEGDLAGYNVYRGTTAGGSYAKVNISLVTSSAYTDPGLTNWTTYYYVVRAVDTAAQESGNSSEVAATPSTVPTVAVAQVLYFTEGGKNGDQHLRISVTVVDGVGNPVAGADGIP